MMITVAEVSGAEAFVALRAAVVSAQRRLVRRRDPVDRLRGYVDLLELMEELKLALTAERDAVLKQVLRSRDAPSNSRLAAELGLSRQRVDQLARIVAAGGRRRSKALRPPS
jgi:hypothetical protein